MSCPGCSHGWRLLSTGRSIAAPGKFYPLLGPRAAIDDTETDASLMTLAILAACFRGDGRSESKPVAEFLELTASTLRAEVERPDTLQ